jgi:hypothetical protein
MLSLINIHNVDSEEGHDHGTYNIIKRNVLMCLKMYIKMYIKKFRHFIIIQF